MRRVGLVAVKRDVLEPARRDKVTHDVGRAGRSDQGQALHLPFQYGRCDGHATERGKVTFNVKQRGKVTYYYQGERPTLSALVTEAQPGGDLKIYFSGLTGGYSAKNVLGRDELVSMDPHREVPLVFECWEH